MGALFISVLKLQYSMAANSKLAIWQAVNDINRPELRELLWLASVFTPAHCHRVCFCVLHFLDKINNENGGKCHVDIFYLSLLVRKETTKI